MTELEQAKQRFATLAKEVMTGMRTSGVFEERELISGGHSHSYVTRFRCGTFLATFSQHYGFGMSESFTVSVDPEGLDESSKLELDKLKYHPNPPERTDTSDWPPLATIGSYHQVDTGAGDPMLNLKVASDFLEKEAVVEVRRRLAAKEFNDNAYLGIRNSLVAKLGEKYVD